MAGIRDYTKQYPLLIYFFLTVIISWGAIIIFAGADGIPATEDLIMVLGMAMLLGPSTASMMLTGLVSGLRGYRELLTRLVKWRVGVRWYLIVLFTAPLSTAAVLLVLSIFSSDYAPNIFLSDNKVSLIITGIIGGISVGLFEELGWTGFATPRMRQRYGVVSTGIIIGLIWGAWHFLLFWEGDTFAGILPFALLLARLFSWLPAYRVLMVWVYDRTESLFVTMLMHVSLVATLSTIDPVLAGGKLLLFILARASVLWGLVALLTYCLRRGTRKTPISSQAELND